MSSYEDLTTVYRQFPMKFASSTHRLYRVLQNYWYANVNTRKSKENLSILFQNIHKYCTPPQTRFKLYNHFFLLLTVYLSKTVWPCCYIGQIT
jgi:hypothetical protein